VVELTRIEVWKRSHGTHGTQQMVLTACHRYVTTQKVMIIWKQVPNLFKESFMNKIVAVCRTPLTKAVHVCADQW